MNWKLKLTDAGKIKYGCTLEKETKAEAIRRVYDALKTGRPGVFTVKRGVYGEVLLEIYGTHLVYNTKTFSDARNRYGESICVQDLHPHLLSEFLHDEHPEVIKAVEAKIINEIYKHEK